MEDLNGSNAKLPTTTGAPFHEDVQKLKYLLSQFEPETSPLRAP